MKTLILATVHFSGWMIPLALAVLAWAVFMWSVFVWKLPHGANADDEQERAWGQLVLFIIAGSITVLSWFGYGVACFFSR